jgi:hypothetical protein
MLRSGHLPAFMGSWVAQLCAFAFVAAAFAYSSTAAADSSGSGGASSTPWPEGIGVVAFPGATEAAWPLAQGVYSEPSLRPNGIDDATARVLCGEAPPAGSAAPLVDLAAAVGALRGEDAPSRILLVEIARRASVRALVTVRMAKGHPFARVFLPETSSFDAATFAPDDAPRLAWSGTVKSLARSYQEQAPVSSPSPSPSPARPAPPLATHEAPQKSSDVTPSRPFYASAWFWGALGGAVLIGGGVYFAAKDTSPSTIHLELQVH